MAVPAETVLPTSTFAPAIQGAAATSTGRGGHWIDDWRPEDPAFRAAGGNRVARRNLVFSILSEHIGFSIWSMWSVFVLFLGPKFGFDAGHKFLLTTIPTAVGSLMALTLTDIVARMLARLASRPNVLHNKDDLLHAVWGNQGGDQRAVEVAIGRLRR